MKGVLVRVSRLDYCLVSRMVHTSINSNRTFIPLDVQFLHQSHYRPAVPHRSGMYMYLLPACGLSQRDQRRLLWNSTPMASPVTQLPQFESTESLFKSFLLLSQKKKKSDGDVINQSHLDQLHRLVLMLHENPSLAKDVWSFGLVPKLVEFSKCGKDELERQARMALSLVGHAPRYAGRGLRILSVDGGGTRGLIPIVVLKKLEELCGTEIYKMFDYVCGTSTGALLSGLLFVKKSSLSDVERTYRELSMEVFKMNNLLGISQLFLNHAFYDCKLLERVVRRNRESEQAMYETVGDPYTPRISVISTVVNQPVIQPFLFCNYRHHPNNLTKAHYLSTCDVRGWEAVMASTAAPGYFEEVKLGKYVHQDGGLLTNNPCAVALHEARLLWGRSTPIQCVISLGTGLYHEKADKDKVKKDKNTSLKEKLTKVVASATDTEAVHTILKDLLPPTTYFRFNPKLTEDIAIDESKPEKLDQLVQDADKYVSDNQELLRLAAVCLMAKKRPQQRAEEWVWSQLNRAQSKRSVRVPK